MKSKFSIITVYSLGHFYVDFICSLILSLLIFKNPHNVAQIAGLIILYNIIAFGSQPFFGFLTDHYNQAKLGAIVGLIVSTVGMAFFFKPIYSIILLAIGNAIYHVGGGIVALNLEPSKAKYPGIYVAPGAVGLFLGALLGYSQIDPLFFLFGGIIISLSLIILIHHTEIKKIKVFKEKKTNLIGIVLLLLLISVCMRALISGSLQFSWKSLLILGLLLTIAIAAGKFFGGFLADKFGFMKVSMIGLIVAAPLLVFFQSIPMLALIGVFCFNLVMPITLTAVAEVFPNYKGFAFGLTTLALVVGYLLFILLKNNMAMGMIFTVAVIAINIGSLYFGLKKYEELEK